MQLLGGAQKKFSFTCSLLITLCSISCVFCYRQKVTVVHCFMLRLWVYGECTIGISY